MKNNNSLVVSTASDAVKRINSLRVTTYKDKRALICINVNGINFYLRFYNTYLKRAWMEGSTTVYSTPCDCKVSEFTSTLKRLFNESAY